VSGKQRPDRWFFVFVSMRSRVGAMHLERQRNLGADGAAWKIIAHPDHSHSGADGIHRSFMTEM
jgi:hypothetical protein